MGWGVVVILDLTLSRNPAALQTGRFNYKFMCGFMLRLLRQRNPKLERATNRSDLYMYMCICVPTYIYIYI